MFFALTLFALLRKDGAFMGLFMNIPNLRGPRQETGGIVYFGRMLDKIRLHAAGKLPEDYQHNLGVGFDGKCLAFLNVNYAEVVALAKKGETDEAILDWCFANGRKPSDREIEAWNAGMRHRGRNDDASARLKQVTAEAGFGGRTDIETFFDFIDADEERL